MKRADALAFLRIAGYHKDSATWIRIYCENRISRPVADKMWREGHAQKAAGVKCNCFDCKNEKTEASA